jgi:hypothetical protein
MNWYKIAKKKIKKPYKAYYQMGTNIEPLTTFYIDPQESADKEQSIAVARIYNQYPSRTADMKEIGFTPKATLDREEWQRILDQEKAEKEKLDNFLQEAWWNK